MQFDDIKFYGGFFDNNWNISIVYGPIVERLLKYTNIVWSNC